MASGAEAYTNKEDWQKAAVNRGRSADLVEQYWNAAHPVAGAGAGTAGPGWGDVSGLFREALAGLSGDTETMYQQGKRKTLADIAMQSVNSGMANTLNMPAAGVAYDEANRAQTNLALGTQRANILTGLGQTAAGMYGTNVGADTSLQTAQIGANTSLSNAATAARTDYAQQALQRYIAQLQNATSNRELTLQYPGGVGTNKVPAVGAR
jgi:hypothetical protein